MNGLLPELRKRKLLDSDYVEGGFRSNLGLLKPWTVDSADRAVLTRRI